MNVTDTTPLSRRTVRRHRVAVAAATAAVALTSTLAVPANALQSPNGGNYNWIYSNPVARWCDTTDNPAYTITYYVDNSILSKVSGYAKSDAVADVKAAFGTWQTASGGKYKFVYGGIKSMPLKGDGTGPTWTTTAPWTITVTFASGGGYGSGYTLNNFESGAGAEARGMAWPWFADGPAANQKRVGYKGVIALDAPYFARNLTTGQRRVVAAHEIGHILNLAHVDNGAEVMRAPSTSAVSSLASAPGPGSTWAVKYLAGVSCSRVAGW